VETVLGAPGVCLSGFSERLDLVGMIGEHRRNLELQEVLLAVLSLW
jgi:hypothetical protein